MLLSMMIPRDTVIPARVYMWMCSPMKKYRATEISRFTVSVSAITSM